MSVRPDAADSVSGWSISNTRGEGEGGLDAGVWSLLSPFFEILSHVDVS